MNEAKENHKPKSLIKRTLITLLILFAAYTTLWFSAAHIIKTNYDPFLNPHNKITRTPSSTNITGYPGPLKITIPQEHFKTNQGHLELKNITITAWPLPLIPAHITTGTITLQDRNWRTPLTFDTGTATLTYNGNHITIKDSLITRGPFTATLTGTINPHTKPEAIDTTLTINNHPEIVKTLKDIGVLSDRSAIWTTAGLSAFQTENGIEIPFKTVGNYLAIGPFNLLKLTTENKTPLKRSNITPDP